MYIIYYLLTTKYVLYLTIHLNRNYSFYFKVGEI